MEFALLLPLLLIFMLGIMEFGRALWTQTSLQYAVDAAARCAAVNPSQCANVPSYAANNAPGLSLSSSVFTYTASVSCGISGYTGGAQVTASYAFQTVVDLSGLFRLIPGLAGGTNPLQVTLSAQSCHP